MQLCVGNHDLYLKRRKVDTMEIQQMKAHAKEELARKRVERDKLEREKGARLQLEREKKELEDQLMLIARQRDEAFIAKEEAEKKAQILEERVKIAEEQTHTLTRKKIETEAEIQRVRASAIKSEEERMMMKKKVIRAEEEAASLQQTAHKRQEEANELRKKLELVQINDQIYPNQMETTPPPPSINQLTNEEVNVVETEMMDDIREQLEKEQQDYIKHSQYLTEKLSALQNEMEDFKQEREKGNSRRQDSIISLDRNSNAGEFLHASVIRQSSYKHSAYDKSKSGSTKSRIAFFEDL
jgi:merlin protein